jgi:hypothetical protein
MHKKHLALGGWCSTGVHGRGVTAWGGRGAVHRVVAVVNLVAGSGFEGCREPLVVVGAASGRAVAPWGSPGGSTLGN